MPHRALHTTEVQISYLEISTKIVYSKGAIMIDHFDYFHAGRIIRKSGDFKNCIFPNKPNPTQENYGCLSHSIYRAQNVSITKRSQQVKQNKEQPKIPASKNTPTAWRPPAFPCRQTPRRYTSISCSEFDLPPRRRAICTSVVRGLSSLTGSTPAATAAR
jgi:hypothetical protein